MGGGGSCSVFGSSALCLNATHCSGLIYYSANKTCQNFARVKEGKNKIWTPCVARLCARFRVKIERGCPIFWEGKRENSLFNTSLKLGFLFDMTTFCSLFDIFKKNCFLI
jgi:hypothetical protein